VLEFRETSFERITDYDNVRLELLVYSLYLTTFEVLKSAIINGVAGFYVDRDQKSDEEFVELLRSVGLKAHEIEENLASIETFASQVKKYEQEVAKDIGFKFAQREFKGLIPSCKWLQEEGVFTEDDVEQIRRMREQRNYIAHHLYDILISESFDFDIENLSETRELLAKVELFWIRLYISIDNPEIYEVPDENIFCPRLFVIDQIGKSIREYIEQILGMVHFASYETEKLVDKLGHTSG